MKYFLQLREWLRTVHELTQQALGDAGLKPQRTYDVRARGREFVGGEKV